MVIGRGRRTGKWGGGGGGDGIKEGRLRMNCREGGRKIVRRDGKREGTTHQKVSRIGNVVARKGGGRMEG